MLDDVLKQSLSRCPFCAGLPEACLAGVAGEVSYERYDASAIVFRNGEPADRLFVVLDGHVVLYLGANGDRSRIAHVVQPGETFGEAAVCGETTYPVAAETLGPALLAVIPGKSLSALLNERFDLVLQILGAMSVRLRTLLRQITDMKMKTSAQRLAAYLVGLANRDRGPAELHLPFAKKLLALQLGMQPETLSRAFLRLQDLGVSSDRSDDRCRVEDVARLRQFCQEPEVDA